MTVAVAGAGCATTTTTVVSPSNDGAQRALAENASSVASIETTDRGPDQPDVVVVATSPTDVRFHAGDEVVVPLDNLLVPELQSGHRDDAGAAWFLGRRHPVGEPAGNRPRGRCQGKGGKAQEVRDYLDKATAAFALNRYAIAAENYEKAFELKPDAAVLYNAAQAYRLAGNKERALELYQSYLRMYGDEKRAEIEQHVENLKQAVEKDRVAKTSPPLRPAPVDGTTIVPPPPPEPLGPRPEQTPQPERLVATGEQTTVAPPPPPPPPPKIVETTPVLVTQPPPRDDDSIVKRPWFWITVGVALVAVGVVGLLLFRPEPSDPRSTLMPVAGN